MKVGIYARVSTHDQQTLPLQLEAMRKYAEQRQWEIVAEVQETESGAKPRPQRDEMLKSARRRELDAILVWKLDRWGRSLADLTEPTSLMIFKGRVDRKVRFRRKNVFITVPFCSNVAGGPSCEKSCDTPDCVLYRCRFDYSITFMLKSDWQP
jgi:hypothetical protein